MVCCIELILLWVGGVQYPPQCPFFPVLSMTPLDPAWGSGKACFPAQLPMFYVTIKMLGDKETLTAFSRGFGARGGGHS